MVNVAPRLLLLIYNLQTINQMTTAPEIAVIGPNTLASLGLRVILEEMIPQVVVRTFPTFEALIDDTPDIYAHYFVASQIYFEHTAFFLERRPKTIVLATSVLPLPVPCLDVCRPQDVLVQDILHLQRDGHQMMHRPMVVTHADDTRELSPREVEVLRLVTYGYINKEIADKLGISLTTVISHRKNITEKLGIKSVSGLAIYAILHGYVEVDSI